jgi:hypothetical protein
MRPEKCDPDAGMLVFMSQLQPARIRLSSPVTDDVWAPDIFERDRRAVLAKLEKLGYRAKDFYANAEFLGRQPSFAAVQELVNAGRAPALIQPRAGVPFLSKQIALFEAFKRAGVGYSHIKSIHSREITTMREWKRRWVKTA